MPGTGGRVFVVPIDIWDRTRAPHLYPGARLPPPLPAYHRAPPTPRPFTTAPSVPRTLLHVVPFAPGLPLPRTQFGLTWSAAFAVPDMPAWFGHGHSDWDWDFGWTGAALTLPPYKTMRQLPSPFLSLPYRHLRAIHACHTTAAAAPVGGRRGRRTAGTLSLYACRIVAFIPQPACAVHTYTSTSCIALLLFRPPTILFSVYTLRWRHEHHEQLKLSSLPTLARTWARKEAGKPPLNGMRCA